MKMTRNRTKALKKVDREKNYPLNDALALVKDIAYAKYDESIDLAFNLDVDPRHAEENIRVTTPLPHGSGKKVSVLALVSSEVKEKEALSAGADYAGSKEFLDKIKNGWTDVDKIIATPDLMAELGKLGKILGPKGLMPNPKSGTVTLDVGKAVSEIKSGQVELRVEKNGIVHVACGKISFSIDQLIENIQTIYNVLLKSRPSSLKGNFLTKVTISSSTGPGVKIDMSTII
ncbi:MAG: 50S ribosomal protein L1 [Candidatus Marinimicrobia bacterium]|nr:50S ribosomal protein L1 [Candidatus Neomarinimicrobiota bacterium]|tara:strand:+ start:1102 stop:1794 length:693 start_codon:yes stop_codon:yes gene_type:complete